MSEYEKFLIELADKLGTTVEKLWSVMVAQAGISATVTASTLIMLVAFTAWSFWLVKRKTSSPDDGAYSEWTGEGAFLAWILWAILAVTTVTLVLSNINGVAAGFLNPEYWALMQLRG